MADIHATFICPAASVVEARAAAAAIEGGAGMLECGLSATGEAPATHYVSSGFVRPAIHDALVPFCTITTGYHDVHDVIAAADLSLTA
jgi:hypothetical protein